VVTEGFYFAFICRCFSTYCVIIYWWIQFPFYCATAVLSVVVGMVLTLCLTVTFWFTSNKNRPTVMRFSQNGSPNTVVFSDVKMLHKMEGYHSHRNNGSLLLSSKAIVIMMSSRSVSASLSRWAFFAISHMQEQQVTNGHHVHQLDLVVLVQIRHNLRPNRLKKAKFSHRNFF